METDDDNHSGLVNEVKSLKSRISQLEKAQLTEEDKLKLAIIDRMPLTVWACDRNFKIVLWNEHSQEVYGYRKDEAFGSDYTELFVDHPEREQAKIDCIKTIDQDVVFKNFIADDIAKNGTRRNMLTNCYRVWDSERNEFLQVEVAVEISDLELRKAEHRTLREVGIALIEQRKKIFDLQKNDLLSRLSAMYYIKLRVIEKEEDRLNYYMERMSAGEAMTSEIKSETSKGQIKIEHARTRLETRKIEISSQIITSTKIDEIQTIGNEIAIFADESVMEI